MFDFQTSLIFPVHAVARAGPWPAGAERLSVTTPDGQMLIGIHIPADGPSKNRLLILGFGGNAWNGQDVAEYLHQLFPDHDVAVFHYRGYAPSTGAPSAEALISDAPLVFDTVTEQIKPRGVVGVGFSIGSGIAAQLSAKRELGGLILVTPFDSLRAVAQSMYPWLPIAPLFGHEIDAAGALTNSHVPVAVIAAERDEIVPRERTEALRRRVPKLVFDRTIAQAGHNDLYGRSGFQDAMRAGLAEIERGTTANPGTR